MGTDGYGPTASANDSGSGPDSGEAPAEPRLEALAPGMALGRFTLERRLGSGAMGEVWAARDPELDRTVAVKVLAGRGTSARARTRLLREAQALAKLRHENVVTVFDVGEERGRLYIAMELAEGETLTDWLAASSRSSREILDAFVAAGRGLAAAHAAGIVHRDFKPGNVLVGAAGVRVVDFGLAARGEEPVSLDSSASPSAGNIPLTRTGKLVGTPVYMSPEQLRGERATTRSDQWSFCVALYEALYRRRPFSGETVAELAGSIERGARFEAGPPRSLVAILRRGLAVTPDARFSSMDALIRALGRVGRGTRRAMVAAGAATAVVAVALAWPRPVRPCVDAEARMAGIWDSAVKDKLHRALLATGRADADDAFRGLSAAADEHARAWVAMRTEACEATEVRHEQSGQLFDLRMQCLDARAAELGALARVFAESASPKAVESLVGASTKLTPLAGCADSAALMAVVPPPADPRRRAWIDALRERLYAAENLGYAGQPAPARAIVAHTVEDIRVADYPPLLARGLRSLGRLESDMGDRKKAEASLHEAAVTAALGKDDHQVAEVWVALVTMLGRDRDRLGDALVLQPLVRAAVARVGKDAPLESMYHRAFGIVYHQLGRGEEAEAELRAALAVAPAGQTSSRADILMSYGNLLREMGKTQPSIAALEEAATMIETINGPASYRLSVGLYNLAASYMAAHRCDDARRTGDRSLAIAERSVGADNPELTLDHQRMGDLHVSCLNDADGARPHYQKAVDLAEKAAPGSLKVAKALTSFGWGMAALGRPAEAEPHLRRALALLEAKNDPVVRANCYQALGEVRLALGDPAEAGTWFQRAAELFQAMTSEVDVAACHVGIGKALLARGRAAEAVEPLERAVEIDARAAPDRLPEAQFRLAQALWDSGRDRARAVSLAREAEAAQTDSADRAKVAGWIRSHSR